MPLITWAYAGFTAGLIVGFSRIFPLLLGAAALLGWAIAHGSPSSIGILLLFCGGAAIASSVGAPGRRPTTIVSTACVAKPVHEDMTDPHRVGSMAQHRMNTPCHAHPGFLARQRLRASITIDSLFLEDAPLAKALLIADQTEIPKPVRDRYAAAGIIHMLSISGLHVAIIAAVIELLLRIVRLPHGIVAIATVATTALYVAVIGFPPPAVRAGAMLAVTAVSRSAQRPTSPWASLAIGGFLPLCIDPRTVLDIGYQLSVGGIAGLIASRALARKLVEPHFTAWRKPIVRALLASVVATTVSAPLVAWSFGRISIIAPLTNLVADPILGLAQPMLFLTLLLGPVHAIARFFAAAAHPLLTAFDTVATWGAAVPGGSLIVHPTPVGALLAGLAAIACLVACLSRFPMRPTLLAAASLCMFIWLA